MADRPDVWPGMPAGTWDALGDYVRWMADRLWLKDWTIILNREPLESATGSFAMVATTEGRKLATIQFCPLFANESAEVIKNTVIHELIHCSHRDTKDVLRCAMDLNVLGQQAADVLTEAFRVASEIHVDSMATAFAAQVCDDTLLDVITGAAGTEQAE